MTTLSGPSQPGVDFGTVLPPDLPGVDIVAPPPSATAKGAKPLGRAFAAAFAHQAVRSSNSLLLKQHVSVASDPEVASSG